MAFEVKSIRAMVHGILDGDYILPAIQRHFVWKPEQITRLFDSLMRDYPIGSFLFWRLKTETIKQYQFYDFILHYDMRLKTLNKKIHPSGEKELIAILDGQQRLTAMLLGLKGTYTIKKPYAKKNNPNAYIKKALYLDLLTRSDDGGFNFAFLTEEESHARSECVWYRVGDILDRKVDHFLLGDDIAELPKEQRLHVGEMLRTLDTCINTKELISYYLEQEQDLDKVLNIFIRVNSGGTVLTYSDLLFSTAIALWEKYDARNEIEAICEYARNYHLDFGSDLVLKGALMLTGLDLRFLSSNFNRKNMRVIEDNWQSIRESLECTIRLVSSYGYNSQNISSYNALLPLALIIYNNGDYNLDTSSSDSSIASRTELMSLLTRLFITKFFQANTDAKLARMRTAINGLKDSGSYLARLLKTFPEMELKIEELDAIIQDATYGKDSFYLLAELNDYPQNVPLEMDHMFPRASFSSAKLKRAGITAKNQIENISDNINSIGNLNLLTQSENRKKLAQPFPDWVAGLSPATAEKFLIPNMDEYSLYTFVKFCEKRRELIKKYLAKKMGIQ